MSDTPRTEVAMKNSKVKGIYSYGPETPWEHARTLEREVNAAKIVLEHMCVDNEMLRDEINLLREAAREVFESAMFPHLSTDGHKAFLIPVESLDKLAIAAGIVEEKGK